MSKVVYQYFNGKALGEAGRLLLAYGGQEFDDIRIPLEHWPEYRDDTPFEELPVMEMNGKKYAQSNAICRFLGRKYGLVGDTEYEAFEIDQNVDFYCDVRSTAIGVYFEEDEIVKKKRHEHLSKKVYPKKLEKLNALIIKNNGHIAAGKLTWGDFVFAGSFEYFKEVLELPDLEKTYPAFQKVVDNVCFVPKVKEFIATAPRSLFGY